MTRDELEAIIWQQMPVTPRSPASIARVEAILAAADAYAATEVGLLTPAERRRVLEQEAR